MTTTDVPAGARRFVLADLAANSFKFWTGWVEGDAMVALWGRVGESGTVTRKPMGSAALAERELDRKCREKERKGYTLARTEGNVDPSAGRPSTGGRPDNAALAASARREMAGEGADPETLKLVEFLAARNVHAIEGATGLRMVEGVLQTPLGRVTAEGVEEAYSLLGELAAALEADAPGFPGLVDSYLRIVPRAIGRRRVEPRSIFPNADSVSRELETLDAVRTAVATAAPEGEAPAAVFNTRLILCPDGDRFREVSRLYAGTSNSRHRDVSDLRPVRLWEVACSPADEAWEREGRAVGGVETLWHGTTDANLLSLLKSGYTIPRASSGIRITGRMFGDGVYTSAQSTKSVRYASGAWGGGRSGRTFLLLNDVATGRRYRPRSSFSGLPPSGYDSTWVEPGTAGVLNHECVVYRASQVRPTYLLEVQ